MFYKMRYSAGTMTKTKTIKFHPKQGIRIPAKTLYDAGFTPQNAFVIRINTPVINIIPEKYEVEEEEKDWLDEALETREGKAYFQERAEEAEREYKEGKLHKIEDVFDEIKAERRKKK